MENPKRVLEENYQRIGRIVRKVCDRSDLQEADVNEAISFVYERFISDDYKIIRRCNGETLPQSYLVLVVTNICRDLFRRKTGRWRSSVRARELGDLACRLEELLYRYGYSFEEVVELIGSEYGDKNRQTPSREEMEEIVSQLRIRTKSLTFMPGDDLMSDISSYTPDYETAFRGKELRSRKSELYSIIERQKNSLKETERLIFCLHFYDNHSVASISRAVKKTRYRVKQIIDTAVKRLEVTIVKHGFQPEEIREILEIFH